MKYIITALIILSPALNAEPSKGESSQQETLAAKIEKFKQENPHSYNIVMGYLKNCLGWQPLESFTAHAQFPNMVIEKRHGQEGQFVRLDTELKAEFPQMLEGDKAPTTPNRLFDAILEKNVIDRTYVKLDQCTRCAYFYQQAQAIGKFRCTTYVPKDVLEELHKE